MLHQDLLFVQRDAFSCTYQERGNGGEAESLEAAEVSVGEVGPEQGCHVGGSVEDIDESGSSHILHVKHRCKVECQVRQCPSCSQLLKCLISCGTHRFPGHISDELSLVPTVFHRRQ